MRLTLSAITLAVSSSLAAAQSGVPIPSSDVDAACAKLSPREAVALCVRQEQAYYDDIAAVWGELPDWRRRKLVEMTAGSVGRPYFYATLAHHAMAQAELERQARDRVDPPRFQRR